MRRLNLCVLFLMLCSVSFCVTISKDWAVQNYAQAAGHDVNCSTYDPVSGRFLSNNYGADLSIEIYDASNGNFVSSSALTGATFNSLGGFSLGVAPNGNIYLSEGNNLHKIDNLSDTTVTPVQGGNTFINPSRNMSVRGSGINTYIAATGASDNGPIQIWKSNDEGCTSFSPWKTITGMSLNPVGAAKAGCAISPVNGSNPPEWAAGCELLTATYLRIFRYNSQTNTYDHTFTQGDSVNVFPAYDADFDFTDGYTPIVAVLTTSNHVIPTASYNAEAMVEIYKLNTFDGSLTLAASYDLKDDLDNIEIRGSLDIDPVNKKIYVGFRTTGGTTHVALARLSYTLDPEGEATPTPTPTISPTPSPTPIPTMTPEVLVVEGYEAQPKGLRWKEVFITPGHGILWNTETQQWGWQRPLIEGTREDWITAMFCNRWLMPYLNNAGATTMSTRERCEQTEEIIINYDSLSDPVKISGTWEVTGSMIGLEVEYFLKTTSTDSDTPTASITYTADIAKSGYYALYFKYPESSADISKSVPFIVTDGAGNKHYYKINQTLRPNLLNYLDTFYFEAGENKDIIEITNATGELGKTVLADVIRIGGGYGTNDWGGGVSGVPRWQESNQDFIRYMGAPSYIYTGHGQWAEFLSIGYFRNWYAPNNVSYDIHSNATTGSGDATGSYAIIYGIDETERAPIYSTYMKMTSVMQEFWDPGWLRRSPKFTSDPFCNPKVVIEMAFHDNVNRDLIFLMDPDFRRITARGLYMGIADHASSNTATYLPETPSAPYVQALGSGKFNVGWKAPLFGDAPKTYRVYYSEHPHSFVDYETTTATLALSKELTLSDDKIYYFQVRAVNDGGISFPTETMAAYSTSATESFLIVNGFDRLDWKVQETDNTKNFSNQHINAIVDAMKNMSKNYIISYASNDSIQNGEMKLSDYTIVDWYTGEESVRYPITNGKAFTDDRTFNSTEQAKISAYTAANGKLFVSGSDVAWDINQYGSTSDKTFLNTNLKCDFVEDDGCTSTLIGTGGAFAGLNIQIDDGTHEVYDADLPDVITPLNQSAEIFTFIGSTKCAGVKYISSNYHLVLFSFPFEAIIGRDERADVMERVITTMYQEPPSAVDDWGIMLF